MPEPNLFPNLTDASRIYQVRSNTQLWATFTTHDEVRAWLADPPALAAGEDIEVFTYAFRSVHHYPKTAVPSGTASTLWDRHDPNCDT